MFVYTYSKYKNVELGDRGKYINEIKNFAFFLCATNIEIKEQCVFLYLGIQYKILNFSGTEKHKK